jgi:hypothetical protein
MMRVSSFIQANAVFRRPLARHLYRILSVRSILLRTQFIKHRLKLLKGLSLRFLV